MAEGGRGTGAGGGGDEFEVIGICVGDAGKFEGMFGVIGVVGE